ncbi:MAG: hypothetical protein WCO30_02800 [bacterium]
MKKLFNIIIGKIGIVKKCKLFNSSENKTFISGVAAGVVAMLAIGLIIYLILSITSSDLSKDKAQIKVTNFLTELIGNQGTLKFTSITDIPESNDLFKLNFTVNGQQADGYMTKNGKLLFPTALSMASSSIKETSVDTKQSSTNKSDKPVVEAFVMSYCPYGTQIEKGLLPVIKTLGDKIDFKLKFVSYAMHGQKEMTENTRQYCIEKEQPTKFYTYLSCFLKADQSESCLTSTGVDKVVLNACMSKTDKEFKITDQFVNKKNWLGQFPPFDIHKTDNQKYGVQGSPTLIINGSEVQANRDSASLLSTICSSFNNAPEVCKTAKLSSASPTPGFGEGTETNSNSGAAGCATN